MKRLSNIFIAAAVGLMLTGCGLYDKYQSRASVPSDVYGKDAAVAQAAGTNMATLSWREFFTDPLLQRLIDTALVRNTDLNTARIAIQKSEAALKAARLAYLPSFSFGPSGSLSKFGSSATSKTYNVPLLMDMEVETFGTITNQKRKSEAVVMQAQAREQAVRANLVSSVAQHYAMLQLLDRQLQILVSTDSLWHIQLETQKALWQNGKIFSTGVNQMEASYLNVKTQLVDTRRNIRSVENAICSLLAITPQHIERSPWGSYSLPSSYGVGVPAQLLQLRPDVRMADYAMAEAFYGTQAARSAFYPGLNLQGVLGWTNNAGIAVVNPGKILLNAVASLTQPIFSRGKLTANLKIARLTQEELQQKYVQTVIDAGNQVNEAIADCQAARDKHNFYRRQVEVLRNAYTGTHELMDNGKASYLEVLTAQETLLNAQLNEAMNMYDGAQALIALYIALGGGSQQ